MQVVCELTEKKLQMDSTMEMSDELRDSLIKAGVNQDVIDKLVDDELCTADLLDCTSDVLLKQCGLKAGQIIRLRFGLQAFKDNCQINPSTPSSSAVSSPHEISTSSSLPSCLQSPQIDYHEKFVSTPNDSPIASFGQSEVPSCPSKNWLAHFELPSKFSPGVSDDLKAKFMASNHRNEFTRDICSSIRAHTMFPTKTEREHVSFMVIKKYPFLADKLGAGIGSWEQAIRNRFKNIRKAKPQAVKRIMPIKDECVNPKRVKRMDVGCIPEKPDGETFETCNEHGILMKKELSKTTNKNFKMVRKLMELTFPFRRENILLKPAAVADVVKEYPALKLTSELKAEFARVMDEKDIVNSMTRSFNEVWKSKILKLAKKKSHVSEVVSEMEEAISDNPEKISEIEENVSVIVLPMLMKEQGGKRSNEIIKICSEDESIDDIIKFSSAPKLVGAGDLAHISPLYIVAEGEVLLKMKCPMSVALALLIGCYYIFNIAYPSSGNNVYLFLENALMGISKEAKKRVSINKFLQELD